MHNTNATADLSACNGTSATLGQHNACPDRDDAEQTRPPQFLSRMTCAPLSSRSNSLLPPMTHRLHISVTMSFFSGIHGRLFHNGRHRRSLWILSNIVALNSSSWPRKLACLAMPRRSQPSLLPTTPESRNASAVKCVTLTTIYGKQNAKTSSYMAILRNSPKTRRCDLSLFEPATATLPKPALTIICGASA